MKFPHCSSMVLLAFALSLRLFGADTAAPAGAAAQPDRGEAVLVEAGQPAAVVVLADQANPIAVFAAGELVAYVRRATGVSLPVVRESELKNSDSASGRALTHVYLGLTDAARRKGIAVDDLGDDAFVMRVQDGDLFILGRESPLDLRDAFIKRPWGTDNDSTPMMINAWEPWSGTLYGVYAFLGEYAGVRFLWPDNPDGPGTWAPHAERIAVPPMDRRVEPAFQWSAVGSRKILETAFGETRFTIRPIAESSKAAAWAQDKVDFLFRHRMRSRGFSLFGSRHYFAVWAGRYMETHPEWFALDEKGVRGGYRNAAGSPMCVSNPEMLAYRLDVAQQPDYLKNAGLEDNFWWRYCGGYRPGVIDLAEIDAFGYCHCAACLAMDSPKAATAGKPQYAPTDRIVSDRYARFWQRVYERAAQSDPNVKVTTYIYFQTFPAPLDDIRLSPNIIGQYCPWYGGNSACPMKQTAFTYLKENWLAWRKTGISLVAYPNFFYGGWVLPYFSSRQLWEWLEFTRDNGAIAYQPDGMEPDRFRTQGLACYLWLRFMEQPNLTLEQARAEYFSAFGPAASAIERYWDYWETWSHQIAENHGGNFGTRTYQQTLSRLMVEEKMFDPAFALLDEARAATRGQPAEFEARVKFLWAGLENARLTAQLFSSLDRDLETLKVPLRDREKFEAARAAYHAWRDFRAGYPPLSLPDPNNVTVEGSNLTGLDLKLLDSKFEAVRLPEEKRGVSR